MRDGVWSVCGKFLIVWMGVEIFGDCCVCVCVWWRGGGGGGGMCEICMKSQFNEVL